MLDGKKILVTAGPTHEPIDPVRFLGNRSSGKMGFAIAEELYRRKADVSLVTGPVNLSCSPGIKRYDVETSCQMFDRCVSIFPNCDAVIMAAAVADYQPVHVEDKKIKKDPENGEMIIRLKKTKDILSHLGFLKKKDQVLVGFSLETDNGKENAIKKLRKKKLDFIVLNTLEDEGAGFGHDTNKIMIIDKNTIAMEYPLKEKNEVAVDIVNFLSNYF